MCNSTASVCSSSRLILSSDIDAAQLRLDLPIAEAPVVSSDALCSPAICVASELVGLAVAEHRASAGHSSAFFGLIVLLPAYSGCSSASSALPSSCRRLLTQPSGYLDAQILSLCGWVLRFYGPMPAPSGSMIACGMFGKSCEGPAGRRLPDCFSAAEALLFLQRGLRRRVISNAAATLRSSCASSSLTL